MKSFLAFLTVLSLAATGPSRTGDHLGAQGPGAAAFEMVICATGDGPKTILIDAEGNVVDPSEDCQRGHCPDCLRVAQADIPKAAADRTRAHATARPARIAVRQTPPDRTADADRARGPPAAGSQT